jgi:porin
MTADAAPQSATGFHLEALYTADLFTNLRGGRDVGTDLLGDASVTLSVDAGTLLGWDGTTAFVYALANHGGDPSQRIGDLQVVSNIEAPSTAKLYEAWVQQNLLGERLSILVGLYDLNSEFDVIEAAGLFLNSSFGIGAEFGLSGRNGPSIFPTTSLGLRVSARPAPRLTLRAAVLDGVPGNPNDPTGTHIILREEHGALIAGEAATLIEPHGQADRARRPIGRGRHAPAYRGKLAVGGWAYTARFDDVAAKRPDGQPVRRRGSYGAYALAEYTLWPEAAAPGQGLAGFLRVGLADPRTNRVAAYTGAGLVYRGPIPGRDADRVGLGVAAAHNGDRYMEARGAAGELVERSEVAIELTYRARISSWLAIQPDLQYIIDPGTEPDRADALAGAIRIQLSY